ncbi:MAG: TetR/AcrR family transcriptional regulator [bacterium]|nr:TetR/AcrR family transcriptional regulator [bacterium]
MPRSRSDGLATRDRLLDAAERLFATQGIQATSLRMINDAAGAKNVSASHYHFGSKDGVIEALVTRRMGELAEERLEGIAAVEEHAGDGHPDLRAAVEAMVLPFLRTLLPPRAGHFAIFLARAGGDPTVHIEQLAPPVFWRAVERFMIIVRRACPALPERVVAVRTRFLFQQVLVAVVELERIGRHPRGVDARAIETVGRDLVDYVLGGLAAPTSDPTPAEPIATPRRTASRATRRAPARVR